MRQIVYASFSAIPGDGADLSRILEQSRHNNAIDGITGVLWSDGSRFLQAFEGPRASMEPCFARIRVDPRHHSLEVLSDRQIDQHEFGSWNMVHRRATEPADIYDALMRRLLRGASEVVRAHFSALVAPHTIIPRLEQRY